MNRLISVVLLVLLVASSGFAAWQYSENQRLAIENTQLKNELDKVSSKLADTDAERMNLDHEVNQTRQQLNAREMQVAQLQAKIAQLEENITALRQQLQDRAMRKGAITIGLTFLWSADVSSTVTNTAALSKVVQFMNRQWDHLRIYFFLYHAAEVDYLPVHQACSGTTSWAMRAWNMYPGNDIPTAIFGGDWTLLGGNYGGCAWTDAHVIAMTAQALDSALLTHELVHIIGRLTDGDMGSLAYQPVYVIPSSWYGRLEAGAKWFQMPLPEGY